TMTSSSAPKPPPAPKLDDVMLAMDVVDTLRYHQTVVARELGAADYDRALADKVRKIYADQGLAVSSEVVAEAVAALREDRFAYQPPKGGFSTLLAKLYVRRGRWLRVVGGTTLLVVALFVAYQWVWVRPAKQARIDRAQRLEQAWGTFQQSKPADALTAAATRAYEAGKSALAQGDLKHFDTQATALEGLATLPGRLAGLRDQIAATAKEEGARIKAQTLYGDALQALGAGDLRSAAQTVRSLEDMQNLLQQAYTLQIVSRPGIPSGVWRLPPHNPEGRNYYLIVEAVSADGQRLTLPITSEEDQQTQTVSIWGLRVAAEVFEQVRRDKNDDGIIQNSRLGVKRRGYLAPDYAIPTTGGAITHWDDPV
ncbi:MAG: DUF6384 family protein, partial [Desulfobacterales bacterium]